MSLEQSKYNQLQKKQTETVKKIIRTIIAYIVIATNFGVAIVAALLVGFYMIDTLNLVGFWVFFDAAITISVFTLTFIVLERGANALNLDI